MGFINNLDKDYTDLLQDILDNGTTKSDRTGTGTISVFGRQIRHNMKDGFPLLTTKKMPFKTIVTELLWFLRGDTNIKFLVDNNCHIWDGDAAKKYIEKTYTQDWRSKCKDPEKAYKLLVDQFIENIKNSPEFAAEHGNLGPVYGAQWRNWKSASLEEQWGYGEIDGHPIGGKQYSKFNTNVHIDQIQNLINDLKTNPDSRRLMVNAWNVGELDQMVLPPCHYGFQVYTRELSMEERQRLCAVFTEDSYGINGELRSPITIDWEKTPKRAISLMWNQRSVDTFLGLPFNIASYGLLLEIIAKSVNMVPDQLIGNLGDVHLYSNHIEQAKEQIGREPMGLPKVNINTEFWPTQNGSCGEGPLDATAVFEGFKNDDFCRCLLEEDIQLSNYQSHPAIKAPLSN
jgi:thymidylate synthase